MFFAIKLGAGTYQLICVGSCRLCAYFADGDGGYSDLHGYEPARSVQNTGQQPLMCHSPGSLLEVAASSKDAIREGVVLWPLHGGNILRTRVSNDARDVEPGVRSGWNLQH